MSKWRCRLGFTAVSKWSYLFLISSLCWVTSTTFRWEFIHIFAFAAVPPGMLWNLFHSKVIVRFFYINKILIELWIFYYSNSLLYVTYFEKQLANKNRNHPFSSINDKKCIKCKWSFIKPRRQPWIINMLSIWFILVCSGGIGGIYWNIVVLKYSYNTYMVYTI